MADLYKRNSSKYWWAKGRFAAGGRWQKSTRQTNRRAAQRVADQYELENALPPERPAWSLGQALDAAWDMGELRGNADSTMDRARVYGAHLVRVLGGDTDMNSANLVALGERYLKERRTEKGPQGKLISDHTIAKELREFGKGLRQGKRAGVFFGEPTALWPVVLQNYYTPRDRWLTPVEFRKLLAAEAASLTVKHGRKPRRDWLVFYVHTGCSQGEIHLIRKTDVDLEAERVFIPGTKTRYRGRYIPLSPEAMQVARRRLETPGAMLFEPQWHRAKMHYNLKNWCKHAEIERCTANDLRRTFCSWMFNAGVPEIVVSKLMGHGSSQMVRRVYAQLSEGTYADAVKRFAAVATASPKSVRPARKHEGNRTKEEVKNAKNA